MTRDDDAVQRLDTPLLTPAKAAQLLAVKPSWIYEAVRAGTLPCLRMGRHIRFPAPCSRSGCAGWRSAQTGGILYRAFVDLPGVGARPFATR